MSNTQQQVPATMFADLVVQCQEWARVRNFYAPNGATYDGQWLKLMEECGEIAGGLARNKRELVEDAIGDVLVVLAVMDGFNSTETPLGQRMWNDSKPDAAYVMSPLQAHYCVSEYLRSMLQGNPDYRPVTRLLAYAALTTIADAYLLTLDGCFLAAYNEIKDRQGIMYNGVFIKDTDPRYAELMGSDQSVGCSGIDVRSMQEDDIVDN